LIGLIILVIVSCADNPLVISLFAISGVWIAILLPLGRLVSNKITSRIDDLIISSLELSEGNTNIQIEVSDKEGEVSTLNYNLEIFREKIEKAPVLAKKTGNGNLENEFNKSGDNDESGSALLSMRDQLKRVAEEDKQRT
jgi:hypothetical protein